MLMIQYVKTMNNHKFKELDVVFLKTDLGGVKKGTKGVIVYVYDNDIYEAEFFDNEGNTISCCLVNADQLTKK